MIELFPSHKNKIRKRVDNLYLVSKNFWLIRSVMCSVFVGREKNVVNEPHLALLWIQALWAERYFIWYNYDTSWKKINPLAMWKEALAHPASQADHVKKQNKTK